MLAARYAVYVPGTRNTNQTLTENERKEWTLGVIRRMSYVFGGATAQEGLGGWVTQDGELVLENVNIVYSYTENKTAENEIAVRSIAAWLAAELKQEAVTIETPDGLDFVSAVAA